MRLAAIFPGLVLLAGAIATLAAADTRAPGTRSMAERLAAMAAATKPFVTPFETAKEIAAYRAQLAATTNLDDILRLKPGLAESLLNDGQTEAAIKEFEEYEQLLAQNQRVPNNEDRARVMLVKAICYLRLGEQQNCLLNHNADSCMFPIRGGGIHQLTEGSRTAAGLLEQRLAAFPAQLEAAWLLNIAHMTLGEYPDKVPRRWVLKPSIFAEEYDIKHFPEVAGPLGLDVDDQAGGVVMEDFDHDGFLDFMVSAQGLRSQLRLFHNNGDGTFTERTEAAGLTGLVGGLNLIHTDYNNDGYADVLVLRGGWMGKEGRFPNSLLRNNGDGTFADVTEESGLLSFHPTQTAVWFDYNGDGWLDLFIGNESPDGAADACELFRNNGNGTFTECAAQNGLGVAVFVKGVVAGDYNRDGRPDLYLSVRGGANLLLRNDGPAGADHGPAAPWRFTNVATEAGVTQPEFSFPCAFLDYDNDGWPDLLVTGYRIRDTSDIARDYLGVEHHGERARLYHNNGNGTFTDVTSAAGLFKVIHAMGFNFGDLDNDGWLDFYAGTGDPFLGTLIPSRMFRNDGGRRFQEVTTSGGFGQLQKGHGIAFGDVNHDGTQDIYSVVGGAMPGDHYHNQLFANPGHGNHWLKLDLSGVESNRPAIGAVVKVVAQTDTGERAIYRTIGSGGSFGASPFAAEIGLGQARGITRVEIFWPTTGKTQVVTGLALDRRYALRENETAAREVPEKAFAWPEPAAAGEHHHHHGADASATPAKP